MIHLWRGRDLVSILSGSSTGHTRGRFFCWYLFSRNTLFSAHSRTHFFPCRWMVVSFFLELNHTNTQLCWTAAFPTLTGSATTGRYDDGWVILRFLLLYFDLSNYTLFADVGCCTENAMAGGTLSTSCVREQTMITFHRCCWHTLTHDNKGIKKLDTIQTTPAGFWTAPNAVNRFHGQSINRHKLSTHVKKFKQ